MRPWIRAVLLFGAVYVAIGRVFAIPVDDVSAWRTIAWVISAAAFATHIWFEHFRLRNSHRSAAFHVAMAVAIGAFGLAAAGTIPSLASAPPIRPVWLLALVFWPAVAGVPAFLVALTAGAIIALLRRT